LRPTFTSLRRTYPQIIMQEHAKNVIFVLIGGGGGVIWACWDTYVRKTFLSTLNGKGLNYYEIIRYSIEADQNLR